MSAKTKKILKTTLNVILWLFLAFSVFMTIIAISAANSDDGLPSVGGKAYVSVLSDSMKPTFKKGDLIVCEKITGTEKQDLKIGDIITFKADLDKDGYKNEVNTHKIIEVSNEGSNIYYTTKGDNNEIKDSERVHYSEVLAKYTGKKIGGVGGVLNFLRTPTGFMVCVVVPLGLFFIYELYNFISTLVKAKGSKEITPEQEDEIKKKAVEEFLKQQAAIAEINKASEATEAADETATDANSEAETETKTAEQTEVPQDTEETDNKK